MKKKAMAALISLAILSSGVSFIKSKSNLQPKKKIVSVQEGDSKKVPEVAKIPKKQNAKSNESIEERKSFQGCDLGALQKFEKKAEETMKFKSPKDKVDIDLVRLMRKTVMVESDCNPNIKHPVAKGVTQIEPATFNGMAKDKNFREKFREIEKRFGVNLKRDWIKDPYTNIVAAYAVYNWKMMDVPHWWDKRYNFKQLSNNYSDKEWNLYKVYYNSIAGKTTLHRWNKYKVV